MQTANKYVVETDERNTDKIDSESMRKIDTDGNRVTESME